MHNFQQNKMFCDDTVTVGREKYLAHRVVLAAVSPYFADVLQGAYCSQEVYGKCLLYVLEHFTEITETEAFLLLTVNEVQELVVNHKVSEDEKYLTVLKWVKHDLIERKENLFKLMKAVKLLLMNNKFFMENVFPENLLWLDLECMTLVLDNTKYHMGMQSGSASSSRPDPCKHSKSKLSSYIFVTGGWNDFQTGCSMSECDVYNSETNTWHEIASMQNNRCRHAVCGLDKLLYAFGGLDSLKPLSSAEYYDPAKDAWSFTTPLPHDRYDHAISSLSGAIFICGGVNKNNDFLCTVEQFDVSTAPYKTCATMNTKRYASKTAVIGDCIYAVGGWNGQLLNSVERFDSREGRWFPAPSMRTSRYSHGVTVLNDYIYCTGGYGARMSGERFDIRRNVWEPIPEMLTTRYCHELLTLDGCIYAVGGFQLNSVEKFDANTNRWFEMPSMLENRFWLGAFVLDCLEIKHP